jgi:hypothetical protein
MPLAQKYSPTRYPRPPSFASCPRRDVVVRLRLLWSGTLERRDKHLEHMLSVPETKICLAIEFGWSIARQWQWHRSSHLRDVFRNERRRSPCSLNAL